MEHNIDDQRDPRKYIIEAKCLRCGKIFCPAPFHVYKDWKGWYCSWTCFNHRHDKKEEEKNENN